MRQTAHLRLVTDEMPTTLLGSTKPKAPQKKPVKFLTEPQVLALAKAMGSHRDRTMVMTAYRHGLRVSELVKLEWSQVNLDAAEMWVRRNKHGKDSTHPIPGDELRDLRRLKREQEGRSAFVFVSRLGGPMTERAFRMALAKAAVAAKLPQPFNPHALRHAAGYKMASEGRNMRSIQRYLGHSRIESTEIYTDAAPTDFRGFFS